MYVLRELWRGNIVPTERTIRPGSGYKKICLEFVKQIDSFEETLPPEGKKQLEAIEDLRSDMTILAEEEAFIYGFRLGARMMMDVLGEYKGQFMEVEESFTL